MTITTARALMLGTAAALLVACGGADEAELGAEAPVAQETQRASVQAPSFAPMMTDGLSLDALMDAELVDASGEEIAEVENVILRNGRIDAIVFEDEELFGADRFMRLAWNGARFRMDGDDLQVAMPTGSDRARFTTGYDVDDQLPSGSYLASDLLDQTVRVDGNDVDVEGMTFDRSGRIQSYLIDGGLFDLPDSVPASRVTLTAETREEVLGAVERYASDDEFMDPADYAPARK